MTALRGTIADFRLPNGSLPKPIIEYGKNLFSDGYNKGLSDGRVSLFSDCIKSFRFNINITNRNFPLAVVTALVVTIALIVFTYKNNIQNFLGGSGGTCSNCGHKKGIDGGEDTGSHRSRFP